MKSILEQLMEKNAQEVIVYKEKRPNKALRKFYTDLLLSPDINQRNVKKEMIDQVLADVKHEIPDPTKLKVYVNNLSRLDRMKRVKRNTDLTTGGRLSGYIQSLFIGPLTGDHMHPASNSVYIGTPDKSVIAHELGHYINAQKYPNRKRTSLYPIYTAREERRASDFATKYYGPSPVLHAAYATYVPGADLYPEGKVFKDKESLFNFLNYANIPYTYTDNVLKLKSIVPQLKAIGIINEDDNIPLLNGEHIPVKHKIF